ncbi:MAG: Nitronate monooxygenase [Alphaproteobacteria bacterium]|nr:Nitronate monooxygenase [Alphaproteobacteria bacterium]
MSLPAELRKRLRLPAMVAPMFLVSGVELAIASCAAGLVGSLTRNHCRSEEAFEEELVAVKAALADALEQDPGRLVGPLAANISIGMDPYARSRAIDACRRHGVDIVVTAGGDPASVAAEVNAWGGRIFHDVTSLKFAEKAIAAGVDGLIAIGAGGGGHSGTMSHLALIPQIRSLFDGTIVMAGAVANGAAIRTAEILGADLAYLGTRFIATREAMAPDEYKALLVSTSPADLVYTAEINGVPAMWSKESMRRLGLDPENLPVRQGRGTGHLPAHVKPWKNLWSAGQGIGLIRDIPSVAELADRLATEYQAACAVPPFGAGAGGGS